MLRSEVCSLDGSVARRLTAMSAKMAYGTREAKYPVDEHHCYSFERDMNGLHSSSYCIAWTSILGYLHQDVDDFHPRQSAVTIPDQLQSLRGSNIPITLAIISLGLLIATNPRAQRRARERLMYSNQASQRASSASECNAYAPET